MTVSFHMILQRFWINCQTTRFHISHA
jgi:hypothetical protein